MRRGIFTDRERMLRKQVRREHEIFKYKMLSLPPSCIYDRCSEIRFYECIYEYFEYCSSITEETMDACLGEDEVISALWQAYLKNEYLKCDTWEDISELVSAAARCQKKQHET